MTKSRVNEITGTNLSDTLVGLAHIVKDVRGAATDCKLGSNRWRH